MMPNNGTEKVACWGDSGNDWTIRGISEDVVEETPGRVLVVSHRMGGGSGSSS
jgi:hypothetical protein